MAGLEIGFESVFFEGLAGGGADRPDEGGLQRFDDLFRDSLFLGNLHQVDDLSGGGQEHNVEVPGDQFGRGLAQRGGVFGKVPSVDPDRGYRLAQSLETLNEIRVRFAVFLEGEAGFGAIPHDGEEFAPGVWFGNLDIGDEAYFADGGGGFRSAHD